MTALQVNGTCQESNQTNYRPFSLHWLVSAASENFTASFIPAPSAMVAWGVQALISGAWLVPSVYSASFASSLSSSATTSSGYSQYTLPADVDVGATLIANVDDPEAVNAQSVCPGYKASNIKNTTQGVTATLTLAGKPCNVYGTDVESLDLSVEYLASDRLSVQITPTHVDASNASWYLIPEDVVPRAKADSHSSKFHKELDIEWTNSPSFGFKITRKATGDVLFDTTGSVLVFENQFVEFVTALPSDYNLYGIGEHIQQLRLLENATLTIYSSDFGNPIDQ